MLDRSDNYASALSVRTTRKIHNFYYGNIFRGHLEEPDVDGRIILRWIFRKLVEGRSMDWIDLAQDRYRWRALVNAVMNLRVP